MAYVDTLGGGESEPYAHEIYAANVDGTGRTRLLSAPDEITDLAWSPDGSKIGFARAVGGRYVDGMYQGNREIYLMNADGTGQRRLTNHSTDRDDVSPAWAPNGTKLAFASQQQDVAYQEIHMMNADGTGEIRVTSGNFDRHPSFSPGGKKIVFSRRGSDGAHDLYVMNTDTGEKVVVTDNRKVPNVSEVSDDHPSWSPDGAKIAFSRYDTDKTYSESVYVMNADGTGQTEIFQGGADPDWGPLPDKVRPTVSSITPAPGSTTSDRTPTISAIVRDARTDLSRNNISVYVDGRLVTGFGYYSATDRLQYTPGLAVGYHSVRITVRDAAGNSATASWGFRVR